MNQALYERQVKFENEMVTYGRDRYLANTERAKGREAEGTTSYGTFLIKNSIEPLAMAINDFMEKANSGRAGRKHKAVHMLKDIKAEVVAFIALRSIINTLTKGAGATSMAVQIGRALELEKKLAHMERDDKERYTMTQHHIRKSKTASYRRTVLQFAFNKSMTVNFIPWAKADILLLGVKLLELVEQYTGLIQLTLTTTDKKQPPSYKVEATEKCHRWIDAHKEKASLFFPDYLPTIIPPQAWEGVSGGGYYTLDARPLSLVKIANRDYLASLDKRIEAGEMTAVLQSVNALQDTAWAIDTKVCEVAQHLWENTDGEVAGLPPREFHRLPHCPLCGEDITDAAVSRIKHPCFDTMDTDTLKAWKKSAAVVHETNISNMGKRLTIAKILHLAQKYQKEEKFYFPYQLDFRGRIYAVPSYLTPQGTDLAKGLLRFAVGKPLGNLTAVRWLAIHGANVYGNDKTSFDERCAWVTQNQEKILASATNPYDFTWWQEADKPFCFLAFCFEWAGYVQQGLDFVSRLPIAMDGTCNGLQIYSLILKDEVGGHAVNLTSTEKPQSWP